MSLIALLAKELVQPLATLLVRTAFGEMAWTLADGAWNIGEQVTKDYFERQELIRHFQRMAEKIVQRLAPRFQQAVDDGGVDLEKVVATLGNVLDREVSAAALLAQNLQPDKLAAAWQAAHPDRWNDFNSDERQLYDAAIADAARYFVQVAAELPEFQSRFAGRVVQQLQSLVDDLDRVLTRVDDIQQLVRGKALDDDRARYEMNYRLAVLQRFDYMELLGADIPAQSRRHPLSIAYVSLSLLADAQDVEEGTGIARPFEVILDELRGRRLLIRGEAGSGKSTLFRWSALQAADAGKHVASPDGEAGWRGCIPFLIRLRDYPEGRLPAVVDLPGEVAKNVGSPPQDWVREQLDNGQALLLFDGVDEVPNSRREDVRQEIESIINAYPGNFYLVSTRPAAVPEGWLAGANFQEAAINPMSVADRSLFIRKWHEAVHEQLRRDKRLSADDDFDALVESLTRQLNDSPAIAHLATNPLLCGMICALHRERQEQLPETQVELCEDLCKVLLHRRELESRLQTGLLSPVYSELNYEQKRGVVQELAHYMVRNGQSSVPAEQADRCFAEALRRFPGHLAGGAADLRQAFVERSGLLREPEPERIDFVHNTLKEYLAGDRFAQLGDTGPLVEHVLDPAWQPAILFAAGSRAVGFADRLIERLLDDGGVTRRMSSLIGWPRGADTERARKIFAVRCGGATLHLEESIRNKLNDVLKSASRPASVAESEAFAALGDFVVPFLKYEPNLPAKTAVACIRTLRFIGTPQALDCLWEYFLAERRPSVFAELKDAFAQVNSIGMQMAMVPPGEFQFGSDEHSAGRPVRIAAPFLLGVVPVTQRQYQHVMRDNPSQFKGDDQRPVENVSWLDVVKFCIRLSEIETLSPYYRVPEQSVADEQVVEILGGDGYRLPTEAEWEYACRAGSSGNWCFGNDERKLKQFAWYDRNSGGTTHAVGQKQPNAWGFHDMHGNVWEWCADWYADYPAEPVTDPRGPEEGSIRVFRGGCWGFSPQFCRSAYRSGFTPSDRVSDLGFRVARSFAGK